MIQPLPSTESIKFLYSYGGHILPRPSDRVLRYVGGFTRVLSVDRSITFAELMVKLGELCGSSMSLKCKLPSEDLDVLVSITSDEDLASVIEEYDRASASAKNELKIRAVLFPIQSLKKISPPLSPVTARSIYARSRLHHNKVNCGCHSPPPHAAARRSYLPAFGYPVGAVKEAEKLRCYGDGSPRHRCVYAVPPRRNCSH